MKIRILVLFSFVLITSFMGIGPYAQTVEKEWQTRMAFQTSYKIIDDLTIEISPELRFDNEFKLDKYLLEGALEYEFLKHFSAGAGYRFLANKKKSGDTEYLHRYKFFASYQTKIKRWKPGFKLSYADYSDDEEEDSEYLRPKLSLAYNIRKSKITPKVGVEYFYQIPTSEWYKVRYNVSLDYKLMKKNYLNLGYKFDYYLNDYLNKNIIEISYKLKF
ncbi:DUF2490 domain-containing protein [Plebeiibacterium sediminum]|uniref:DUF2490 domain-containing protein n=1 Tax=Plebeiibacterium sediminum TaxID=2992112 RepID=A0AAE3M108_9BACT|nr:DUF2490 domain-containing protein [Plebeiobacterium sediminum]MCW3785197.1 DUF2490 domain-containing protein [Plebeiobacterium sediminum]